MHNANLAKSAKSKTGDQEDAKSNITDENNTSAAETTIPLDEDTRKSNGDISTKSGKHIISGPFHWHSQLYYLSCVIPRAYMIYFHLNFSHSTGYHS